MDLQKVKEALIIGLNAVEVAGWTRSQSKEAQEIKEAIAELEKPVDEDAGSVAVSLFNQEYVNDAEWMHASAVAIQQYAEAYHAKRCGECKQKRAPYRPFGIDPLPEAHHA